MEKTEKVFSPSHNTVGTWTECHFSYVIVLPLSHILHTDTFYCSSCSTFCFWAHPLVVSIAPIKTSIQAQNTHKFSSETCFKCFSLWFVSHDTWRNQGCKYFFFFAQILVRNNVVVSDANTSWGYNKKTYLTSNKPEWLKFKKKCLDGIELSIFFHTTKSPLECPIFQQPDFHKSGSLVFPDPYLSRWLRIDV